MSELCIYELLPPSQIFKCAEVASEVVKIHIAVGIASRHAKEEAERKEREERLKRQEEVRLKRKVSVLFPGSVRNFRRMNNWHAELVRCAP